MAWRIHQAVVRGEIDNRVRGTVTGTLWLIGRDDPIQLKLTGDCWRDIAGCLLTFENPSPQSAKEHTDLNALQGGQVGDMTASRKVRVFDIPTDEALEMLRRGERPPEHKGNAIYLEWYSDFNGRVVIESADYQISISAPTWDMDEAEETQQREKNERAIFDWMERLAGAVEKLDPTDDEPDWSPEDDAPMNEFEWEKFMKESDKRTDKLMELYEKYDGIESDEKEQLIAREMGWDKQDQDDNDEDGPTWEVPDMEDFEQPEPDPLTEGTDWVRDEHGYPVHPLYLQCFNIISVFRKNCKKAGLLDEKTENPLNELIFSAHMINAKLAGALNSIWMDHEDGGFIVANLKRSLKYFNETMSHFPTLKNQPPETLLTQFHTDLCAIREEILRLMDHYRNTM